MTLPRPRLRLDLRTLLLWTVYVAVGCAMAAGPRSVDELDFVSLGTTQLPLVRWVYGLLGAASAAIAVGLFQQASAIRRHAAAWTNEFATLKPAARWESGLRQALASILIACIAIHFLTMQRVVELPESDLFFYGDVATQYVWWLAILAALSDACMRAKGNASRRRWLIGDAIVYLCATCLAFYIVTELSLITFLVHVATHDVDSGFAPSYTRYPIVTYRDEWMLVASSAAASTAIVVAGAFFSPLRNASDASDWSRRRSLAFMLLLTTLTAAYAYWFYSTALNYYSPDLASVGSGASWWKQLGGIVLGAMLVSCVAYRAWHSRERKSFAPESNPTIIELPFAAESLAILLVLLAATTLQLAEQIWMALDETLGSWTETLPYLLVYPSTYFIIAMLLASIQLMRLRWQGRAPAPLTLIPLKSSEFVASWLLLAMILAVAIPTFAAFSFSFWLGPWYRW